LKAGFDLIELSSYGQHRSRVQLSAQLDFTENKALKGDWK